MLGASFFSSRLVFVSMARVFVAKLIGSFFRQSGVNKICALICVTDMTHFSISV